MEKIFNAHDQVVKVKALYHQFLRENNCTPDTVYGNILWQWPDYIKTHKTW